MVAGIALAITQTGQADRGGIEMIKDLPGYADIAAFAQDSTILAQHGGKGVPNRVAVA